MRGRWAGWLGLLSGVQNAGHTIWNDLHLGGLNLLTSMGGELQGQNVEEPSECRLHAFDVSQHAAEGLFTEYLSILAGNRRNLPRGIILPHLLGGVSRFYSPPSPPSPPSLMSLFFSSSAFFWCQGNVQNLCNIIYVTWNVWIWQTKCQSKWQNACQAILLSVSTIWARKSAQMAYLQHHFVCMCKQLESGCLILLNEFEQGSAACGTALNEATMGYRVSTQRLLNE